jgi:3-phenylpropionate/trans-cinnamate dioxygenase ferredoxin reductase subunit
VGVGIRPNTGLAEAAGLDLALGGVAVDEMLRSSDPSIWAGGVVASAFNPLFGERVRVEHWANASNQGKAAGLSMAEQGEPYAKLPYFFTDQYDLGMEYHGWVGPDGYDDVVLRGDPEAGEWLAFWLAGGHLLAGMTVNVWDQGDPVKAMARARTVVDPTRLADPGVPLTDLV